MKFVDDSRKQVKWWNRNYFWLGTLLIVLVNVVIYFVEEKYGFLEKSLVSFLEENGDKYFWEWTPSFFYNTTISFLCGFQHGYLQHLVFNMICFSVCAFYLERKTGTLGLIGLVFIGNFFSCCVTTQANIHPSTAELGYYDGVWNWSGFSATNFFLYAFILVDYCFSLTKERRTKTNMIMGAICFVFVYLVDVGVKYVDSGGLQFGDVNILPVIYPWNLLHNMAHISGFVCGLLFTLAIHTAILYAQHKNKADK